MGKLYVRTQVNRSQQSSTAGVAPFPINISQSLIIKTIGTAVAVSLLGFVAADRASGTGDTSSKTNNAAVQLDASQSDKTSSDQASAGASGPAAATVKVTVNGQNVPVPPNSSVSGSAGSVNYTASSTQSGDGTATNSNFSSVNTNVSSSSFNSSLDFEYASP